MDDDDDDGVEGCSYMVEQLTDLTVDALSCSRLESLPVEIIKIVLDKLPYPALLRCKLLSKSFSKTISVLPLELRKDPFFFFKSHNSLYFVLPDSAEISQHKKVYKPIRVNVPFQLSKFYITGSCNGYMCLSTSSLSIQNPNSWYSSYDHLTIVFNPLMPQHLIELRSTSMELPWASGFGYDPKTDEHKVVLIYLKRNGGSKEQYVQILTLGTNHWRSLNAPIYNICSRTMDRARGIYLNGWMYWLGERHPFISHNPRGTHVIVGLNLNTEEFKEFPAPNEIILQGCEYLIKIRGQLALVAIIKSNDELQIWVMGEDGEKGLSWRRSEFVIQSFKGAVYNLNPYDMICLLEDDKLLLQFQNSILCYDFGRDGFIDFEVEGMSNLGESQDKFEAVLDNGSLHGIERCSAPLVDATCT